MSQLVTSILDFGDPILMNGSLSDGSSHCRILFLQHTFQASFLTCQCHMPAHVAFDWYEKLGWRSWVEVGHACTPTLSRPCCFDSNHRCSGFKFSQLEMSMFHTDTDEKLNATDWVEVVLLLLIESFKISFAPGQEIYWHTQRIAKPSVVGFSDSRLPLVVERAVW